MGEKGEKEEWRSDERTLPPPSLPQHHRVRPLPPLHVPPFMRRVVLFNHCLAFIINAVITAAVVDGCGKQESALADTEEESTINADGRRSRDTVYSPLVLCGGGGSGGSDWNLFRTQTRGGGVGFEIVVLVLVIIECTDHSLCT